MAALVRGGERKPVYTSKMGLALENISGPYGRFFIAAAAARMEPHANSGPKPMDHPGEELVHVLDGSMEFEVDGETYALSVGDSLHFRTDRPHRWSNPKARPATALWMALRPS